MNPINNEELEFLMNVLEDDNRKHYKKVMLETFIDKAITKPEEVDPELIFFVGKLLERLKNEDYEGARKSLGFNSKRDENKPKKFAEKCQLISDVNFLIKTGVAKGAQGALVKLVESSPYYNEVSNSNSLQATYRKAVKDIVDWFQMVDEVSAETEGQCAANQGSLLMKYLYIFIRERDPLI